jgi:P27 family predicted phage terminase small subunit
MGLRGKKTQTIEILKAKGTYRMGRHSEDIQPIEGLKYVDGIWDAPEGLNEDGKSEWYRVMNVNQSLDNYLSVLDIAALIFHCHTYQDLKAMIKLVLEHGTVDERGKPTDFYKSLQMVFKQYNMSCNAFGLTPLARAKLPLKPKKAPDEEEFRI